MSDYMEMHSYGVLHGLGIRGGAGLNEMTGLMTREIHDHEESGSL